jgi:tetratricopeptide (TPR) repeat protein
MLQRTNFIFRSRTLVLLCIIFWVAVARPQGRYEAELTKAEQAYSEGFFDQVINVVKSCLDKGDLTTAEQAWAYKLLGQAYISKNELQPARIYVQKLLEAAPDYKPDRDQDLQLWIELVEAAKQERERQIQRQPPKPPDDKPVTQPASTRKSGGKKWLWIGSGGAVVAGTAVYLILKGEGARERLPDPPEPPSRP